MTVLRTVRRSLAVAVTVAAAGLVAVGGTVPASANPDHVDPAALHRGAGPRLAHLVGDTIVDGHRRVAATTLGEHDSLWTTARGYVVDDVVRDGVFRLVHVGPGGHQRVIARRDWPTGTAVSPSGTRIAWGKALGRLGPPTVVRVANPDTGRVLAGRRFHFATVFAVSESQVLLTRRARGGGPETTWWWDYRHDTLSEVSDQPARRVDLRHDRVVFATGPEDSFCMRVAPLSEPARTLWASCRVAPHAWSPSGARATATHTYFDETGTDRWLTVRDRTGQRLGRVNGRLDWDTAWEDDRHVLTMAQNSDGKAAVVRCTVGGRCERASRIWDVGWDGYPPYYVAPPVVLSKN